LLNHRSWLRRANRAVCYAVTAAFLAATPGPAWSWQTAHGNPDNTGFVDVQTVPATVPKVVENLGTVAPGAGPVIAPDGTVYVGNKEGWLMSFKPDGTPGWKRQVAQDQMIVASPAIGSDGTIYVVGMNRPVEGQPDQRADTTMHRFNNTGGYLGRTPFPDHNGQGATVAAPNIWRFNGVELAMVPAVYPGPVGGMLDIRLLAFMPGGGIATDQSATSISAETTGGGGVPSWYMPICMTPPVGTIVCLVGPGDFGAPGSGLTAPMPGIGIYTNPQGGTPWILLSDHYKDLVGFTYSLADNKFYETFRKHESNRYMRSAPTILPNLHTIIGYEDIESDYDGGRFGAQSGGVVFSGPNLTKVAPVTGLQEIYGSPTRLKDGRVVLVGAQGELTVLNNVTVAGKFRFPGKSIVSAAASRTHFFVSTSDVLLTYETATLIQVGKLTWTNGGMSPPVIGPLGHVYAIAGNQMMVFAPLINATSTTSSNGGTTAPKGGVFQEDLSTAKTKQAISYKPPLSKNGYRLFACLELDGDDCGKKDHREIAKQYCVKEGYTESQEFDVETRKGKAETLAGDEYCSKKKCKVFEEITCKM
jgi:hypothetical protein